MLPFVWLRRAPTAKITQVKTILCARLLQELERAGDAALLPGRLLNNSHGFIATLRDLIGYFGEGLSGQKLAAPRLLCGFKP